MSSGQIKSVFKPKVKTSSSVYPLVFVGQDTCCVKWKDSMTLRKPIKIPDYKQSGQLEGGGQKFTKLL